MYIRFVVCEISVDFSKFHPVRCQGRKKGKSFYLDNAPGQNPPKLAEILHRQWNEYTRFQIRFFPHYPSKLRVLIIPTIIPYKPLWQPVASVSHGAIFAPDSDHSLQGDRGSTVNLQWWLKPLFPNLIFFFCKADCFTCKYTSFSTNILGLTASLLALLPKWQPLLQKVPSFDRNLAWNLETSQLICTECSVHL